MIYEPGLNIWIGETTRQSREFSRRLDELTERVNDLEGRQSRLTERVKCLEDRRPVPPERRWTLCESCLYVGHSGSADHRKPWDESSYCRNAKYVEVVPLAALEAERQKPCGGMP